MKITVCVIVFLCGLFSCDEKNNTTDREEVSHIDLSLYDFDNKEVLILENENSSIQVQIVFFGFEKKSQWKGYDEGVRYAVSMRLRDDKILSINRIQFSVFLDKINVKWLGKSYVFDKSGKYIFKIDFARQSWEVKSVENFFTSTEDDIFDHLVQKVNPDNNVVKEVIPSRKLFLWNNNEKILLSSDSSSTSLKEAVIVNEKVRMPVKVTYINESTLKVDGYIYNMSDDFIKVSGSDFEKTFTKGSYYLHINKENGTAISGPMNFYLD